MSGLPLKDGKRNPSPDTHCQGNSDKAQIWSSSLLERKTTLPQVYSYNTYLIKSAVKIHTLYEFHSQKKYNLWFKYYIFHTHTPIWLQEISKVQGLSEW